MRARRTIDAALIDDLVSANHILALEGIVDGFGHVSVRDPRDCERFFLSRSMAPATVGARDIMVFALDGEPIVIVQDGKPIEKNLRKERLTVEELLVEIRQQQLSSLDEVAWAVLETSGKISIIPKQG